MEVSVTVITNTLLMWFAYKAFADFTWKVTETVSQFETSKETKAWLGRMQSASEHAVTVTEAAKIKIAGFEPALARAQDSYVQTLARVNSKLETTAGKITDTAQTIRDVVAKPAFSAAAFAARLSELIQATDGEE